MKRNSDIIMKSENNVLISRLNAFRIVNNNALGSNIKQFGTTLAFQVQQIPGPAFNTVRNLNGEDLIYFSDIETWYNEQNMGFQIEVTPHNASQEVFRQLHKCSFYQTGFHASFIGDIQEVVDTTTTSNFEVELLQKEEFTDFADVYVRGFGLPEFITEGVKQNNEILYDIGGWRFFKATLQGKIVGIAVLYVQDDIATLAAATTLSEYRGQGIQKALIQARAQYALPQGAKYITSEAQFGSISHSNMQKSMMDLVYTKAIYNKNT
ncbi:GNAT family N-acetyltransferase [Viridibacillus sp. YIM B01967]|uniref:GNAT family N-acetyltransferase n=1 Tax=Viridibacillus soli TaxID=2798301 RepID=A0ABS1H4A2_9BACL|nr:GNAT family N-acetyltransferase [Viridibacillus soli]MBK3494233.1 GNAT family N-acetyltransferase [Viridibacillus soli]